jgi:ribose 5-phosphate isomerase A
MIVFPVLRFNRGERVVSTLESDRLKAAVAGAAMAEIPRGGVLGVGTGSTVNHFIDRLAAEPERFEGFVSSSEASSSRMRSYGLRILTLDDVGHFDCYVDGADEVDPARCLIKGGGGALTREKIVAEAADRFVCIVDESKRVEWLGAFPLPIEIIPMARRPVEDRLRELGGEPMLRADFVTDNGGWILDVAGLKIYDPPALEEILDRIPGVVTNGLFARRPADVVLLAGPEGIRRIGE